MKYNIRVQVKSDTFVTPDGRPADPPEEDVIAALVRDLLSIHYPDNDWTVLIDCPEKRWLTGDESSDFR